MVRTEPSIDGMPRRVEEPGDNLEKAVFEAGLLFREMVVCAEAGDPYLCQNEIDRMKGWLEVYGKTPRTKEGSG